MYMYIKNNAFKLLNCKKIYLNLCLVKYNSDIHFRLLFFFFFLPPRPGTNLLISFSNTFHLRPDRVKQRFQGGFGFRGIRKHVNKFMNEASVTVHYGNE